MILNLNNKKYSGFESLSVTSSMDTLTDVFSIKANNIWAESSELKANKECKILEPYNQDSLITGYISKIEASLNADVLISGFDKTYDLAGSTIDGTGEFNNLSLKQICEQICSPFDISVSGEDGETVKQFRYGLNELASDVIKRLVIRQGYLAYSDTDGNLVIANATTSERCGIALVEGDNMISGKAIIDTARQRSLYKVVGQNYEQNNSESEFEGLSPRYRPQVIIDNGSIEIAECDSQSSWVAHVVDGSVASYVISVTDIQNVKPNTLIDVKSRSLGVDGTLLVRSVNWKTDSSGSSTTFTLSSPYAFGGKNVANSFLT